MLYLNMTLQAISRDLQLECFDVRLCLKKTSLFPVFDHKYFVYDYDFDVVLCTVKPLYYGMVVKLIYW